MHLFSVSEGRNATTSISRCAVALQQSTIGSLHSSAIPRAVPLQDGRGRLRKIDNWVAFPFLLDIGAFCRPANGGSAPSLLPGVPGTQQRGAVYQLLGVVEHRGDSLRHVEPASFRPSCRNMAESCIMARFRFI